MEWFREFCEYLFPEDSKKLEIEKAFNLKHKHIPNRLFKYRSADEYSKKNLKDGTIWLAHPSTFNDPYDCHIFFSIDNANLKKLPPDFKRIFSSSIYKNLEERIANGERPLRAIREILLPLIPSDQVAIVDQLVADFDLEFGKNLDKLKNSYRVCSFSARLDSMLMWSHYADQHRGFCIEYDVSNLPPTNFCNRFMYPVIYQDEVFDASTVLKNGDNYNNLRPTLIALAKAKDWQYEEEWRIIIGHGIFKEIGVPFNMPNPKAVYLGAMIQEKDATEIKDICEKKEIPVFRMEQERNCFRMKERPI